MVGYMPELDVEENIDSMEECYQNIMSGQVTYAVRDTTINGRTIRNGDIMGINDEGIQAVGSDVEQTTLDLISKMVDADSELISLYYGETVTKEQAAALTAKVEGRFPDVEVETKLWPDSQFIITWYRLNKIRTPVCSGRREEHAGAFSVPLWRKRTPVPTFSFLCDEICIRKRRSVP